jgi:hypothetical protein
MSALEVCDRTFNREDPETSRIIYNRMLLGFSRQYGYLPKACKGIVNLTRCDCRSGNFSSTGADRSDRKDDRCAILENENCANLFRYALGSVVK